MKKSKIFLVTLLSILMCIMCLESTTFSWFVRPQSSTGKDMSWAVTADENVLANTPGSNLTVKTYQGTPQADGTIAYGTTEISSFTNVTGITGTNANYYHTVITNANASDCSVSLYFPSVRLTANPKAFALGVNSPTRMHKKLADTTNQSESVAFDTKRLYFLTNTQDWWTKTDSNSPRIRYSLTSGDNWVDATGYYMQWLKDDSGKKCYYYDLPVNAKTVQIGVYISSSDSWATAHNVTPYMDLADYSDNNSFDSMHPWVFYLHDNSSGSYDNYNCNTGPALEGVGATEKYSNIEVAKNDTFDASLDYSGVSITYASSNTSVFTVNASGVITGKGVGTATLTTTIYGGYERGYHDNGDLITITTPVTVVDAVSEFSDVSLVTNMLVPAKASGVNGTTDVYWYIKNESSTNGMTYVIPNLYMTL